MTIETIVMNRRNSARQPEVRALICLDITKFALLFILTETVYPKI